MTSFWTKVVEVLAALHAACDAEVRASEGYAPQSYSAPGTERYQADDTRRFPTTAGANGTVSHNTYPVGSPWQESVRLHPTTGRQAGTDRHYFGRYEGTYSNGAYTYDPDGRTTYQDD